MRRSTVYRHFPDEATLFDACSSHWASANPPPDVGPWEAIEDPDERLRTALGELYEFYGRTERMMDNLHRDEAVVPLVRSTSPGSAAIRRRRRSSCCTGARARPRPRRDTRRDRARARVPDMALADA